MLFKLRWFQVIDLLLVLIVLFALFGVSRASAPVYDGVGDDIEIPDWWKPFTYRPAIPLSECLQCILWNACLEYDVPIEYVLAIIDTESGFQVNADSGVAHGLMQLHKYYFDPNMPPGENIIAGVKLLRDHYDRYGNWPAAITAYAVGHDNGTRAYWMIIEYRAQHWKEVMES